MSVFVNVGERSSKEKGAWITNLKDKVTVLEDGIERWFEAFKEQRSAFDEMEVKWWRSHEVKVAIFLLPKIRVEKQDRNEI